MGAAGIFSHQQLQVHLFADSQSNFYPVPAYLPKEQEKLVSLLQPVIDTAEKSEMKAYCRGLKALG